jgi:hypothetical protein
LHHKKNASLSPTKPCDNKGVEDDRVTVATVAEDTGLPCGGERISNKRIKKALDIFAIGSRWLLHPVRE